MFVYSKPIDGVTVAGEMEKTAPTMKIRRARTSPN